MTVSYFVWVFAFCQIIINFLNTANIRRLYKRIEDLEKENGKLEAASKKE